MKLFFVSDLHGSEICWKKFLNAGAFYQADAVPKSLRWKLRSRVGERVQWYELPEEVAH